ncbi:hypothetical protein [Nonomuraea aurantiaca]|uniref:hypothetical protein n=1 Tax=Nonomuraea aurantiaca TaxID=2878562 RepID=UPI001CD9EA1A|nr:hypothetical protein [Nonomuraea aurantiaca]MCA2226892.1 hypothetical protein [Nonomuraea aurantiaca]
MTNGERPRLRGDATIHHHIPACGGSNWRPAPPTGSSRSAAGGPDGRGCGSIAKVRAYRERKRDDA